MKLRTPPSIGHEILIWFFNVNDPFKYPFIDRQPTLALKFFTWISILFFSSLLFFRFHVYKSFPFILAQLEFGLAYEQNKLKLIIIDDYETVFLFHTHCWKREWKKKPNWKMIKIHQNYPKIDSNIGNEIFIRPNVILFIYLFRWNFHFSRVVRNLALNSHRSRTFDWESDLLVIEMKVPSNPPKNRN